MQTTLINLDHIPDWNIKMDEVSDFIHEVLGTSEWAATWATETGVWVEYTQ